ncbi:hypothetical protein PO878_20285 [Iamia majanohamensis]|uniref:Uncharacterized protein n=1 Tax=Iamia majanohamensis TaxID=467976 RepID=A0AAF0BVB0_9ACTN|nr:hypothetical protein [Iamia majanohamensis]WCO66833.1 hypothetical protein PO878_20285 [Iamia majanohamensis]
MRPDPGRGRPPGGRTSPATHQHGRARAEVLVAAGLIVLLALVLARALI